MSWSFDPSAPVGVVRLLSADYDERNPLFSDESVQALLDLNNQVPRLAAAQALDIVATNEAIVQKMITLLDLKTNGPAVALSLRAQAAELRRQVEFGIGDPEGVADWVELVYDPFTARQRAISQWLRSDAS